MWSDIGFNIPISEGKYWLDDTFIECFDKQGVLHKLYKYKVNQKKLTCPLFCLSF